MNCQFCNANEANYKFYINFDGRLGEINLCSECVKRAHQRMSSMFYHSMEDANAKQAAAFMGFTMPDEAPTCTDPTPIPTDMGAEIKQRRLMGELRAKLQRAVESEDYETAAQLRDEIHAAEKKPQTSDGLG